MVKRISRRFVSLLLTFVTILTLLPAMTLPALAATRGTVTGLADENIGLSFTGDADDAWSANGTSIIGAATSKGGACSDTSYDSTLTITNKKSTTATLSFDYSIEQNGGKIQVDGKEVSSGASFTKELAANRSVKVYIKSGSTSAATKITMTNVKLVADATATVTFQPAVNGGSYTVDGKLITEAYANTQSSMTAYQVVATPAKGYQFLGWYNETEKKCINTSPKAALNIESDCTITARFASATAALFETGGQRFADLNEAVAYAQANGQSKITLATDGSIGGSYTIPAGITLLIPFDEARTLYTDAPAAIRPTPPFLPSKAFRTLTMAANSSITLASGAAISVGGQYYAAGGGQSGQMVGPYGCIRMESGSAITVQDGASLYAWGFISGNGAVTVQPGGSVYEWYQILDFRGGSATSNMGNKVFPFNQYAVQNIEVPLTMHTGASETAYAAIYASSKTFNSSISFIGAGSLFELTSGSLTKAYDGSTDRMIYTINGEANLKSLNLKLAGIKVDSSTYVLPLTNNMTIDLKSGSKLTLNQTAALLPGVEVSIARDAELVVSNGQSMYIYDEGEWGGYCGTGDAQYMSVVVAPGRTGKRAPLKDVKVDVNGKLTAIGGIYTTAGGANICSSEETGKYVQQDAPGKETKTYQYTQKGGVTAHEIPITAAKLKNADGNYIETKDAKAGKTFTYCICKECNGKWEQNVAVICNSNGEQTGEPYRSLQGAVENLKVGQYIKLLHNTTEKITAKNNLYLDLNGYTVTGNFDMAGHTLYGMDSSGEGYDVLPTGKIVGGVSGYAKEKIYQTAEDKPYDRYVAVLGTEADGKTQNLSFHRFNISVSGYRFELATGDTPQCALFFIGKFQGDDVAKGYLESLGFTLTGENDAPLGTVSYSIPKDKEKIPEMPVEGEMSTSDVVHDADDDAFLFEAYLMRDIDKEKPATYKTKFTATAQATFDNGGKQSSDPQALSFQDAWQNPGIILPEQKEILDKFRDKLGITNQTE